MRSVRSASVVMLFAAGILSACGDTRSGASAGPDETPPVLRVLAPSRGAIVAGTSATIDVRGTVQDGRGVKRVEVNGEEAIVEPDGTFAATVAIDPGMTLLKTTAEDRAGNLTDDTRAVIRGNLVSQGTSVYQGIVARVTADTLFDVGTIAGTAIEQIDLGTAAQPFNPVVDVGGSCLNARVDVLDADEWNADLYLYPVEGGLYYSLWLDWLWVDMNATFKVACLGGSSGVYLTADTFELSGVISLDVAPDGSFDAEMASAYAAFQNFNLDVGFIPGSVVNLFAPGLDMKVASIIASKVADVVPTRIEQYFDSLAMQHTSVIAGRQLQIGYVPTRLDLTYDGAWVGLDTTAAVLGSPAGPGYVSTPAAVPPMPAGESPEQGIRIAMADDVLNQSLTAFWNTGVMNKSYDVSEQTDGGIGPRVERVDVWWTLPPFVVSSPSDQDAKVYIGDLQIDAVELVDGVEKKTRVYGQAVAEVDVIITEQNKLRLRAGEKTAWFDIVEEESDPNPIEQAAIDILGGLAFENVVPFVENLIGEFPIPSLPYVQITGVDVTATSGEGGYLVLGATIEPN